MIRGPASPVAAHEPQAPPPSVNAVGVGRSLVSRDSERVDDVAGARPAAGFKTSNKADFVGLSPHLRWIGLSPQPATTCTGSSLEDSRPPALATGSAGRAPASPPRRAASKAPWPRSEVETGPHGCALNDRRRSRTTARGSRSAARPGSGWRRARAGHARATRRPPGHVACAVTRRRSPEECGGAAAGGPRPSGAARRTRRHPPAAPARRAPARGGASWSRGDTAPARLRTSRGTW